MQTKNRALIEEVITEFQRKQLLRDEYLTPFQKTEKLVSMYSILQSAIVRKKLALKELAENGIFTGNAGITERIKGGNHEYKADIEKQEDRKEQIQKDIEYFEEIVKLVDFALETIKADKYYRIIELKYFNKKTLEDISEELGASIITIKRNKNRLINEISHIFITEKDLRKLTEF